MSSAKDKEVRERLVARGAESLSDAELLSILLGEGRGTGSAIELAGELLSATGNSEKALGRLAAMDLPRLRMSAGIGIKKAAMLAAGFEAGKRAAHQNSTGPDTISGDEDVLAIFRPLLAHLPHEEFWVLYLSSGNRILDRVKISQGGTSATVVDHKLIVKRAVELLASAIIVVHNHPSGVAKPSKEDIALTNRLIAAASLFEIALLDHVIVASGEHFSFRAAGMVK